MDSTSLNTAPRDWGKGKIMAIDTKAAFELGQEFARQINNSPAEAQNWSEMGQNDDLPEFDFWHLREEAYGKEIFDENSAAIERAYRNGFNSVFEPIE